MNNVARYAIARAQASDFLNTKTGPRITRNKKKDREKYSAKTCVVAEFYNVNRSPRYNRRTSASWTSSLGEPERRMRPSVIM